ncbi:putative coproporphyrinogen dehydrogenase [Mycobacterium xenopi 3993]|nr:putative coproporphyrinogen dehydrogenase [Mycobacterium xenopi 3993]
MDAAVEAGVDHVSAYALVVEEGTALARRVRRGELAAPDGDVLAHRYEIVDALLQGPVSTGMRSPTGADPAGGAGTTSATGMAASGGVPDREPTAMSVSLDGGMSSTPIAMQCWWPNHRFR